MRTLLLFLFLSAFLAHAQDGVSARPRIGLALSGGGAKGLTHVGVLRWLEEHRIPVDVISGTSMGGLIGGIYATGLDSAQIRDFVIGIDWEEALATGPAFRELAFRRKEDQQSFPASLEFGVNKGKFQLPSALNAGHRVGLLLDRVALPFSSLRSFDDLPTPFRCVATDLRSGEPVVFASGELSRALRATMSLPAIFSPVMDQQRVLVDGGMVNNIPTEAARDMGANVIIAVDLGISTFAKDRAPSILDIANRSIEIMIRRNELESLKLADIVVAPPVGEIGTLQFENVDDLMERGYRAAEAVRDKLLKLSVDAAAWQAHLEARRKRNRPATLTPAFVSVEGGTGADRLQVQGSLQTLHGGPLDRELLERRLDRVEGWGPFASIGYRREVRPSGEGLVVELRRKRHGPLFLKPLMVLDSGQANVSTFTLGARLTGYNTLTRNSELRADVSYGRVRTIGIEHYQFLGPTGFFVAPRGFATEEQQLIVSNGQRLANYSVWRGGGGVDIGFNFGRYSEVRTGFEIARVRGAVEIGLPLLPRVRGREALWSTGWRLNTLNSNMVPTSGLSVETRLLWQFHSPDTFVLGQVLPLSDPFGQAWANVVWATEFSQKWSGLFRTGGGGTFAGSPTPFAEFRLGGPLRLGSLEVGEKRGANYGFASMGGLRRFYESATSPVRKLYGAVLYETGDAFDSRLRLHHSGTVGIASETGFGVIFVGVGYGEQGRRGFFFSIGRTFDSGVRFGTLLR